MSLPLQTEYTVSKFATKAYGETKENIYVPLHKDTKESRGKCRKIYTITNAGDRLVSCSGCCYPEERRLTITITKHENFVYVWNIYCI